MATVPEELFENLGNEPIPIVEERYDLGEPIGREDRGPRVMASLDAAPPERVRFTAPAVLKAETGENIDGAVVNLSLRGVAVVVSWQGSTHDRIWLQFRLGLAEDPVDLLCEVIWCAPRPEGDFLLGMRFAGLTEEEAARIQTVVSERAEGRAGEWPLPIVPEPALGTASGAHPWLTAAAGMAAGIGLALALSAIPSHGDGPAKMLPAKADPARETIELVAITEPVVPAPPQVEPSPTVVPTIEPAAAPVVVSTTPAAPRPDFLPRKESERQEVDGDLLRPLGTAKGVELALVCDGPVNDHLTFWLESPQRLVVDVYGRKSGFARRAFRIENGLARGLRVGQHADKVRFVIETSGEVAPQVVARPAGNSLVVELERKG